MLLGLGEGEIELIGERYLNYGEARDCMVVGNYCYIANGSGGLAIVDLIDFSKHATSGNSHEVYVKDNYAYLADGQSGLAIINISDPTSPGEPRYRDTSRDALEVYVKDICAYIIDSRRGLCIIDVSDPTSPGEPIYRDTPGSPLGVYVKDNYIYVADANRLVIFTHEIDAVEKENISSKIIQNYPNPFNPECWIPVGEMENREGKIKIYNILGQLVREIEYSGGQTFKGANIVYWDGRDSQGLEAPSGVYFYEVAEKKVRKMIILR
jgi:hypothetical protein